ncbi:hypothetical protein AAK706_05655 [Erysipelotrichaceae bacterium 66-17]|nr:hypothetical protein EROP_12180 [Erysipelotrichaceae bacterium OPF54]
MIIIAMGYSGTGSSAIIHLLSEYRNCTDGDLGKFEHLPFYTPHGLFDLEDTLLYNNSLYRSDAAINDFYNAMKRLNDYDFGWFGGYEKRYGGKFMKIVDEFLSEIVQFKTTGYWSYDFELKKNIFSFGKDTLKKIIKKESKNFGKKFFPYGDNKLYYSFVEPEEFYSAAKKFVLNYFKMINPNEKHLLVDQIILPQHLDRIKNYFNDDVRFIVFDRDIRDIYILNKYIYPRMYNMDPVFPSEPNQFIKFYSKYRKTEKKVDCDNILRLNFEDLVYNYKDTVKEIENFLDFSEVDHINKYQYFIPEISKKNTQNFRIKEDWVRETEVIAEGLKDLVYPFPYEFTPNIQETTDP